MLVLPASVTRSRAGLLAFLLFPVALGLVLAEPSWVLVPVVLAWLTGYPWSRALRRHRRGDLAADRRTGLVLAAWTLAFVPASAVALVLRPWLLLVVATTGALLLVEWLLDRRGRGNLTTGAAIFVAVASGLVGIMDAVVEPAAWVPPVMGWRTWLLIGLCALGLTSLLLHAAAVTQPLASRWTHADRGVAVAGALALCVVAAAGTTRGVPALVLLVPAGVLLAERTYAPAARSVPTRFGDGWFLASEIGCLVLVVLSAGLALHL